jgi:hypothetical protein
VAALWLDAVLRVKLVHRIEPRTQAARRDDDVNVVRKSLLDPRYSLLARIARHFKQKPRAGANGAF